MADFIKYQALGNDYLLIDPLLIDPPLIDPPRSDVPCDARTARAVCDRHLGPGADGVLFGPLEPPGPHRPAALAIFNADGSPCARSANGIRMFALYLAEHYGLTGQIAVRTDGGQSVVEVCEDPRLVRIGLGRPSLDPRAVPVTGIQEAATRWTLEVDGEDVEVTTVSDGNPHTVVLVERPDTARARDLGPRIAGHPRFPQRTNVEFVHVADRATLDVEIWERAAGYTPASGSGACAAAAAARAHGLVQDTVTVRMPGGAVEVEVHEETGLWLTGPVEQVMSGSFSPALRARLAACAPASACAPARPGHMIALPGAPAPSTQSTESDILLAGKAAA
jgi:diaminopimelate epimerase